MVSVCGVIGPEVFGFLYQRSEVREAVSMNASWVGAVRSKWLQSSLKLRPDTSPVRYEEMCVAKSAIRPAHGL